MKQSWNIKSPGMSTQKKKEKKSLSENTASKALHTYLNDPLLQLLKYISISLLPKYSDATSTYSLSSKTTYLQISIYTISFKSINNIIYTIIC